MVVQGYFCLFLDMCPGLWYETYVTFAAPRSGSRPAALHPPSPAPTHTLLLPRPSTHLLVFPVVPLATASSSSALSGIAQAPDQRSPYTALCIPKAYLRFHLSLGACSAEFQGPREVPLRAHTRRGVEVGSRLLADFAEQPCLFLRHRSSLLK